MLIKMLKTASGPDGHFHVNRVYDVAKEKAEAFIEAGAALLHRGGKVETATKTGAETTEGDNAGKGGKK